MPGKRLSVRAFLCAFVCTWLNMAALAGQSPEEISQRSSEAIEKQRKAVAEFPRQDFSQTATMLEKKEFGRYEALLKRYMAEWKGAPDKERNLHFLFSTTDATNADLLYRLNEWITQDPSAIAFLVRGAYLNTRGQLLRGGAPTNATPALNLALLAATHLRAATDLQQAIKLEPGLLPAYSHLLEVAKYSPAINIDGEKLLAEATRQHPLNLEARRRYLDILNPAWGGSLEAMERFTQSLVPLAEANPLLWALTAQFHYEKAMSLPMSEGARRIAELTTALKYANLNKYYESRAWTYMELRQYSDAIADFERCALTEEALAKVQSEPLTFCAGYTTLARAKLAAQRTDGKSPQEERK